MTHLRSKTIHGGATVVAALLVSVGAWTVYWSFGRTPPVVGAAERRVLSVSLEAESLLEIAPTVQLVAARGGVVSAVMGIEGMPIAEGDVLVEFDREETVEEIGAAVVAERQNSAAPLVTAREARDNLEKAREEAERWKAIEAKQLETIRAVAKKAADELGILGRELDNRLKEASMETEVQTEGPDGALLLVYSALEGSLLSQNLALSDIRTFFGANSAPGSSAFLRALPLPQSAVPLWERLLEAEELSRIVQSKLGTEFTSRQEAFQALLSSKAMTEHILGVLEGLGRLASAIEPSNDFPLAELDAKKRLLSRNVSGMETALDSLRIHEQRLIARQEESLERREVESKERAGALRALQALYGRRGALLSSTSSDLRRAYADLERIRERRAQALEQHARAMALDQYLSGIMSKGAAPAPTLAELLERLDQTVVRASGTGIIQSIPFAVGQAVNKGDAVAVLATRQSIVRVVVDDPHVAELIRPGSAGRIMFKRGEGDAAMAAAVVERLDDRGDGKQEAVVAIIGGETFPAGTTVKVLLEGKTSEGVVAVPKTALRSSANWKITVMMKENGGDFVETPVEVGVEGDDGWVEIRSGVGSGSIVMISP